MPSDTSHRKPPVAATARRDLIVVVTAVVSLLVLGALGTSVLQASHEVVRIGAAHGSLIAALLLLNLAFTVYGWRRYRNAVKEVGEKTIAEKKAQVLASSDPLTGLLNRRSMAEPLARLLIRASANRQAVAMLVVDIDGFKSVNDLHGHLAGDNLLRVVAELIPAALPGDHVTARLGADRFAAAFPFDPADPGSVEHAALALVERLGRPFDLAGAHVHVSASAGLASTADCREPDALLRRADIAMRAAKKAGRGRQAWFGETMQRELRKRDETEAGLRAGLAAGEFVPHFEQQIDLATGTLRGFEMLARWQHPKHGLVPPDEFISIAEECGLIGELSLSVMRQALAEAREWDNSLTLSVNLSPIQLKDPWLAQKLAKLLSETGFPAERLEVEITERSLFENLGLAQAIVSSLKNQGIRLALDDFGTGYSSIGYLRALPFDRVKIDRSFVTSINDNPESASLVTALTRVAESLNLEVTAEGIENDVIEARLRSIGTYTGQGWIFGKPMPLEEVRGLLASRGLLPARRSSWGSGARPRSPARTRRTA